MNSHKIKKKLFVPLFVSFIVVWVLAVLGFYTIQSNSLTKDTQAEYENVASIIDGKIEGEIIQLRLFADLVIKNFNIKEIFTENDRNRARQTLIAPFENAQKDLRISDMILIRPDQTVLSRMRDPIFFDDTIKRTSLLKSKELKRSYFYIEPGINQEVKIRVVIPVEYSNNVIAGYLEVSKSISSVIEFLEEVTHMDFSLLVDKKMFDRERWLKHKKFEYNKWELDDSVIIYYNSIDTIEENDLVNILSDDHTPSLNPIDLFGRSYLSKTINLKNVDGKPFASLKILHDNSSHQDELQKGIIIFSLVSLALLVLLSLIFYKILENVERKLLTNQRDLETELKSKIIADQKLKKVNQELRQLTYIAAHDLKAPITNLQGLIKLLENEVKDKEQLELIHYMKGAVYSSLETIEGINTIIEEAVGLQQKNKKVIIAEVFNEILNSLVHLVDESKIKITGDFSGCPDIMIYPGHLKSILQNLIVNAIKYSDPQKDQKIIEVISFRSNEGCSIGVADNGIGIDLSLQGNKVFGLFKRFHSGIDGKGIGLYLVKMLVDHYNGSVDIKSEPGKGTSVFVNFKTD